MKAIYSRPLTAPAGKLPPGFTEIGSESELSAAFGARFPPSISERMARLYLAAKVLARERRYDVTITGRYGEWLAALRSFVPGTRRHILLDVEWTAIRGGGLRHALNRWVHQRAIRGAARVQVFCHVEAANYVEVFKVDASKFAWIPLCVEVPELPRVESGDYILSSGSHHRDYPTLLSAAQGLRIPLLIVAEPEQARGAATPSNVRFLGAMAPEAFWKLAGGARLIALSLDPEVPRRPGVITYVSAMRAGKCVVVNDPAGASSYIEHGVTGFLVEPRDPEALRRQIETLLADPGRVESVGREAARVAAERFSSAAFFSILAELSRETAARGR